MSDAVVGPVIGRRQFFSAMVVIAGAAALAGPAGGLLDSLPGIGSELPFTRTHVVAKVGEQFRIADGPFEGVKLIIGSVGELPGRVAAVVVDDQFAARFSVPDVELAADMYWFATESFGKLPLYISPLVDADGRTVGYEALVNRHVPAGGQR
jgi:hypothetical protein